MTTNGLDDALADDERETLRLLRAALQSLPAPRDLADRSTPDAVVEGAYFVHAWHNIDADLAELTFDSVTDRELVGVRSATALRQLTFVSDDVEINIEIEPSELGVSLTGTVSPVVAGSLQLMVGGVVRRATIDRLGTFVIDDVDHGTVLAFLEVDRGTIRLGSFEV